MAIISEMHWLSTVFKMPGQKGLVPPQNSFPRQSQEKPKSYLGLQDPNCAAPPNL